jgi:HK97 gp10 family phage protein
MTAAYGYGKYGISEWRGDEVFVLATKANEKAMHKAGAVLEADIKTHFTVAAGESGVSTEGRKSVRKTKSGKRHYRSKPGEPPAVDTGTLRASTMTDVTVLGLGITGRVGPDIDYIKEHADPGTDVEYGFFLELGTVNMEPRPFLRPALIRTKDRIKKIFKKANS